MPYSMDLYRVSCACEREMLYLSEPYYSLNRNNLITCTGNRRVAEMEYHFTESAMFVVWGGTVRNPRKAHCNDSHRPDYHEQA